MSVFTKLRHFPEFHIAISALDDLNKAEASLISSQSKTFGEEFRRWAKAQRREDLNPALTEVGQAGAQQVKLSQETAKNLENVRRDLQPLLTQETERSKRREVTGSAESDAEKSTAAAERADAALSKLQNGGKPAEVSKAEAAAAAARAKAEHDRKLADELKAKLDESEVPYRRKFLESLVSPLTAAISARYKTAEALSALAVDFEAAAGHIHQVEDPQIAKYQKELEDLEGVVVE
jgi:hypothetical protein